MTPSPTPLSFVLPHYGPPSTLEPMYITTLLQRRRHIVGGASRRHGKVRSDEVFIIFWSSSQIFPPHVGNWCRWSIDSLWLFWNVWTLKTKWSLRWFYQDSKKYPNNSKNPPLKPKLTFRISLLSSWARVTMGDLWGLFFFGLCQADAISTTKGDC